MLSKPFALPAIMALTGGILILREAVFYTGFAILNGAINWPASLGLPAAEVFGLLRDQGGAMFAGYYVYMLSSFMFIPIAVCLRWLVAGEDDLTTILADIALAFAIVSAAFRVLGILRWLFAMPVLSQAYLDPASSEALRQAALLNYDMLSAYAGQTGEHLGVRLTGTLFLGFFALAFLRSSRVPTVFAIWAGVSAILFFPLEELLGTELDAILFINGFTYSFWAIFFGGYLILASRRHARTVLQRS
jgi:hypothetical protein